MGTMINKEFAGCSSEKRKKKKIPAKQRNSNDDEADRLFCVANIPFIFYTIHTRAATPYMFEATVRE